MNELALFAGAGGGILGGKLLGWRTVCAVEINPYCRRTLARRQDDGILAPFPIWDDVTTFDGKPWRGVVEVVSGGFPCQDISAAGKGAGIAGARSGLWGEMRRIVGEVRPRFVLVENSPVLTSRGLGTVLGDLAALGFDARWGVLSAADAIWLGGTPCLDHLRERIWIAAADASRIQPGWAQQRAKWERAWEGRQSNADGRSGRCSGEEERQIQQPGRAEAECPSEADAVNSSDGRRERRQGRLDPGDSRQSKQALQDADGDGAGRKEQWGGAVR